MNAFDILMERGFIAQSTHEDELRALMGKEKITFYIGYDPTADSLTAGHYLTLMALAHLQKAGHRPITLMGTGTGMIGDPSDRNDMRRVMTVEEVQKNIAAFKKQFSHFIDYTDNKAIMDENDWLLSLEYVKFLREYGVHFNVNRMLAAECYKSRLGDGLTLFEFNYMIMQAYDFLHLYRKYGCTVQMGGNDQWSNIIAGADLIRKTEGKSAYGFTLNLLTVGEGEKMGKSTGNAVWLDPNKTTPYAFYQHWRNTADSQVIKNLKLLTFLDLDEINQMAAWQGSELNKAKEILAFEVTKTVHGEAAAHEAQNAARALFSGGGDLASMPTTDIASDAIAEGLNIISLLDTMGLLPSRSEGRRLIQQGGVKVNGAKIESIDHMITAADFEDGSVMVQKGKKIFHRGILV